MGNENKAVVNCYQGILITETVLGNPNGSFVNNEPRNINGRVFTTDKCIKYNIRNYMREKYEKINKDENGNINGLENFVFFYPRLTDGAKQYEASYLEKDSIFENYFVKVFESSEEYKKLKKENEEKINKESNEEKKKKLKEKLDNEFKIYEDNQCFEILIDKSPDCKIFGGTFSFKRWSNRQIYGPIQLSYGIDLIGADIIALKLGTPFSTEDGNQKTTGEEHVVDHAVIGYDITVNPNHSHGLLKEKDLEMFKEGIVYGTNTRRSTSKKTEAKVLIMIKFQEGISINVGELKHLIKVKSKKIMDPKEHPEKLILDMSEVKKKLDPFMSKIDDVNIYYDDNSVQLDEIWKNNNKVSVKSLACLTINTYLFSWDDVPGSDSKRLVDYLVKDLKIDWAKDAKINKTNNDKTIKVTKDEKSLEIELSEKRDKVFLKSSIEKTREYISKMENNKINIYKY